MYENEVSPEDALKKGCVITKRIWEEIVGLPESLEVGPKGCVQGDMCASTPRDVALLQEAVGTGEWSAATTLWKDPGHIPVCLASSLAPAGRQATIDSFQHFTNMVPCIGFKQIKVLSDSERSCTEDGATRVAAIYIGTFGGGCYATVGAPWEYNGQIGNSYINLGEGCHTLGVAAHELGHALGMHHEQSRTDSPNYVEIFWNNIQESKMHNYNFEDDASRKEPYGT